METIIVGVDSSPTAQQAAETAAKLAAATGSRLLVVSAVEKNETTVIDAGGSDRWTVSSVDDAKSTADEMVEQLKSIVSDVSSTVAVGKPAEVLVDQAEATGARVIVVGNRRMQGPGRLLGSIASAVAHHAPCDVYIVKTT